MAEMREQRLVILRSRPLSLGRQSRQEGIRSQHLSNSLASESEKNLVGRAALGSRNTLEVTSRDSESDVLLSMFRDSG
jgi:hypothetical protein